MAKPKKGFELNMVIRRKDGTPMTRPDGSLVRKQVSGTAQKIAKCFETNGFRK